MFCKEKKEAKKQVRKAPQCTYIIRYGSCHPGGYINFQTFSTDNKTVFALFFHWSSISPKEDVVYCTSLWRNTKKSLKRRNQLYDGSQQSSQWSQSASNTSDWQNSLCFVQSVWFGLQERHRRFWECFQGGLYSQMSGWCPFTRQIQWSFVWDPLELVGCPQKAVKYPIKVFKRRKTLQEFKLVLLCRS